MLAAFVYSPMAAARTSVHILIVGHEVYDKPAEKEHENEQHPHGLGLVVAVRRQNRQRRNEADDYEHEQIPAQDERGQKAQPDYYGQLREYQKGGQKGSEKADIVVLGADFYKFFFGKAPS